MILVKNKTIKIQYYKETKNIVNLYLYFSLIKKIVNYIYNKLMLLFYLKYLKTIVSTINIILYK